MRTDMHNDIIYFIGLEVITAMMKMILSSEMWHRLICWKSTHVLEEYVTPLHQGEEWANQTLPSAFMLDSSVL
jgi:hypothetical protein